MSQKKIMKFIGNYKKKVTQLIGEIDDVVVSEIVKKLLECDNNNASIYVIGNGGSAATASHMQNDLGVGLKRRGILGLNILSLCDNLSAMNAIANDIGYEDAFYLQLKGLIEKDDLVIAISCSGNSGNIIKAVEYAKENGAAILGMTGFDGGDLRKMSDISYHVQTENREYGLVEDLHMILNHMLYSYFIERSNG